MIERLLATDARGRLFAFLVLAAITLAATVGCRTLVSIAATTA